MIIIWIILIGINIIVSAFDMFITRIAVDIGLRELNPLIIFLGLDSMFLLNLISLIVLIIFGFYVFFKLADYFNIYCYSLIFVDFVICMVVIYNTTSMLRWIQV